MGTYEELKHVGFVKLIEVKVLAILSNIYGFFKDNSRCLKETVVSVENKVIDTMRPVNEKLTVICEYKLGFIDDKIEKYAPTFIKYLVDKFNSCIEEKISLIERVFGPLVHKAKIILEKDISTIESLLQKCIDVKKSIFKHMVSGVESILEKSLGFVTQALDQMKSVVGGVTIIGDKAQSFIIIKIDMVTQLIQTTTTCITEYGIFGAIRSAAEHVVKEAQVTGASIIQKASASISKALEATISVVGGIPIIGSAAKSIITKQTDMISQFFETTTTTIKENGLFGAITAAAKHVVQGTQETGAYIIQKGSESISQALDTTKTVVGGIPIIGDAVQSVITKQTDIVSQIIETTTSSIKENGIFGAITSAAEQVVNQAQETSTSIIQKGSESVSQALDTTKSIVGGIPIIGDAAQSIITNQTDMASKLIETTTSSIKENGIFGAITSAAENVVKGAQETSASIIQKGSESVSQAVDTTKSVVGGIPIIGDAAQSIITNQTDMASKLIETTTSSIKENGIFGAITSAAENVVKGAQETSSSIIQKGSESISQAIDTTKSVVGGIPIIGDAAQSIITKQTDTASQLIENTTSSIKENGIFGAIISATGDAVKKAQETTASIVQKGSESASQVIDKTKSVVGGIPIIGDTTQSIGDTAQSIINKQTDVASQLINTTISSVEENGIIGAITSATQHVVNEAQTTGASIIQKGSESASQALDTTKTVVGGIPVIGNTAQSIITKQTDMASQFIQNSTSSIKENGIFGAITSATEHVVKEAQSTSTSIIQKGTESASQALDTTKSVVGGIPVIGDAAQSIITKQTDMASQLINTTTSSVKENGIFGTISAATQHVVKEAQATSESIIQKSSDSASQALETTKSVVGSIPIIGNTAQSIITKQTDAVSQVAKSTTSSVKKHGLFGAIISAAEHVVKDAEKTTKTIVQKSVQSVDKSLKKTKSTVEGVGNVAHSILGKQASITKKLFSF